MTVMDIIGEALDIHKLVGSRKERKLRVRHGVATNRCKVDEPTLLEVRKRHFAACHYSSV